MKHIVVVTSSFPDAAFKPGQEAAGTFVYDFVVELARLARVTTVAPTALASGTEQTENLTICRFAVPSLPLSLLKISDPTQWNNIIKTMFSGLRAVREVVKNNRVDHIFALWALPSGYWAKSVGAKYGVPYSVWALGSDIWSLGKVPLVKNVLQTVLRQSRYRFADGYRLAHDVKKLSGSDCEFLPSMRKLSILSEKKLSPVPPYKLAFLGRWHQHKGTDLLLESLLSLKNDDWNKIDSVRIYGGGPLETLVYEQSKKLNENGRPVTLGGYLNRNQATDLMLWADYLIIPSRIESIPVIFSDAMQANCPVISMPVGDLPRLVGNSAGILADSVTVFDLTKAIRKALSASPVEFSDGLKLRRKQFDMEQTVTRLVQRL